MRLLFLLSQKDMTYSYSVLFCLTIKHYSADMLLSRRTEEKVTTGKGHFSCHVLILRMLAMGFIRQSDRHWWQIQSPPVGTVWRPNGPEVAYTP